MNITNEMIEALQDSLGKEGVYVGNKTCLRALIAALGAEPREPVAWQPIETAPKHYKPIWACNPQKGHEGIVVHTGSEWELLSHDGFPMGVGFYPTHWMPLPNPPALSGGEDGK